MKENFEIKESTQSKARRKIGDIIYARGWYRKDQPNEVELFDSWEYGIESAKVIAATDTGYLAITAHGHRVWVCEKSVLLNP